MAKAKANPEATDSDASPQPDSSSSWFSQAQSFATATMDDQRMERLRQCQSLEDAWQQCRENRPDRLQLEDFPMGIRMVRYLDWRGMQEEGSNDKGTDDTSSKKKKKQRAKQQQRQQQPHCHREAHAVWMCRGTSLACGNDVVRLRSCLKSVGPEVALHKNAGIVYESDGDDDAPCGTLQQALAQCVSREAYALQDRREGVQK